VRGNVVVAWAADEGRTIALIAGGHLAKASVGYEIHAVIEQSTTKDGKSIERKLDGQHFRPGAVALSARYPRRSGRLPACARWRRRSPGTGCGHANGLSRHRLGAAGKLARHHPGRCQRRHWPHGGRRTRNTSRSAGSAGNPDPLEHKRMDPRTNRRHGARQHDKGLRASIIEAMAKQFDSFGVSDMAAQAIRNGTSAEDFTKQTHGSRRQARHRPGRRKSA
jgi:hypothetical protein